MTHSGGLSLSEIWAYYDKPKDDFFVRDGERIIFRVRHVAKKLWDDVFEVTKFGSSAEPEILTGKSFRFEMCSRGNVSPFESILDGIDLIKELEGL